MQNNEEEIPASASELMLFLHRTIADLYDLLDPRASTPHQNAVAAHAKARKALKTAAAAGVLS